MSPPYRKCRKKRKTASTNGYKNIAGIHKMCEHSHKQTHRHRHRQHSGWPRCNNLIECVAHVIDFRLALKNNLSEVFAHKYQLQIIALVHRPTHRAEVIPNNEKCISAANFFGCRRLTRVLGVRESAANESHSMETIYNLMLIIFKANSIKRNGMPSYCLLCISALTAIVR